VAVSSRFEFALMLFVDDDIVMMGADEGITDTVTIDVETREASDISSVIEEEVEFDEETATPLSKDLDRVEIFRSTPQL
jgi:hypothetical protein